MPFPELRRRLREQTPQERLSKRKISLKNIFNTRDSTHTFIRRIKNLRIRFAKKAHSNQHQQAERQKVGCISTYPQE
jgi:hypothetical protein